ncbi:DUF4852 domain-containing protein [Treponema sp.]|uniref:DUF4852 domain-containing protein n=1 Tax=Treponema sp. TaxID=166 RepID=UPI003FD80447
MKKILSMIFASFLCLGLFAQEDWGDVLDWKKAYYSYVAGTDKQLNDNQYMYLIYQYFYDDYKQFHNDEFEWEDHKANDIKAINEEIASCKNYKDKKFYVVTRAEFGSYDFEKQGYPVNLPEGTYFSYQRSSVNSWNDATSDMALYMPDMTKYNFFPMEKSQAKTFQTARKDRWGEIDRNIILVIHYTIEDFGSEKYKKIEKQFAPIQPVVGNISSIEIFDENNQKIGDLIQK